ncbi:MAG: hypothetical protein PHG47_03385 [Sulfuricella sp.]|nr:hypothetical protein [Sulfuricella sp.]
MDAPRHFVADGENVDKYAIGDWVFAKPFIAGVPARVAHIFSDD